MRTNRGQAWYAVSSDLGETWTTPQPMCTDDRGAPLLHPASPCPIYDLGVGEYLFLFQNNDGYAFGASSRWDVRNRRPAFLVRGQFRPATRQPIWWGAPTLIIDNDAVPWGPPGQGRLEAAAYTSLTKAPDGHVLWYPDHKGFLLGKLLTDAYLKALEPPKPTPAASGKS